MKEITAFDVTAFDQQRLGYYRKYAKEYYNDAFRPHQGTEVILDVLRDQAPSGVWLDMGAGPSTLFWGLMLSGIKEIHCSELFEEGLYTLDDFFNSDSIPRCYQDVMGMYGISPRTPLQLRTLLRKYLIFDALSDWPEGFRYTYDLITSFGVFGLTLTEEQYVQCFSYMKPYLKKGGVAIGANWIRSQSFIDGGNTDNRFMTTKLVEEAAKRYGFKIQHLSEEVIQGDPNYDKVIVWSLQNIQ